MIIAIIVVAAAICIGIFIGSCGDSDSVVAGNNQRSETCNQACTQWQTRKAELCDAERAI